MQSRSAFRPHQYDTTTVLSAAVFHWRVRTAIVDLDRRDVVDAHDIRQAHAAAARRCYATAIDIELGRARFARVVPHCERLPGDTAIDNAQRWHGSQQVACRNGQASLDLIGSDEMGCTMRPGDMQTVPADARFTRRDYRRTAKSTITGL
jgi:hypothetical protein